MKHMCFFTSAVKYISLCTIALALSACAGPSPSKTPLGNISSATNDTLYALNRGAKSGRITGQEGSSYLYYGFTDAQRLNLRSLSDRQDLSLTIFLSIGAARERDESADPQFSFGFLYDTDFDGKGGLNKELSQRSTLRGSLASRLGTNLQVAMTMNPQRLPRGFFVYANTALSLQSAAVIPAVLGWDQSEIVPAFFYSESGGTIPATTATAFDFSDGASVFRSSAYPALNIKMSPIPSIGTQDRQETVSFTSGEERIVIRRAPNINQVNIPCAGMQTPYAPLVLERGQDMVWAVVMQSVPYNTTVSKNGEDSYVTTPIRADPGTALSWQRDRWRVSDYELFAWDNFPNILFFDMGSYRVQDEFLKRLAFFTEKQGYRGRLASDAEIANQHGFNAHDYRAESLADFYTLAEQSNFPLNRRELQLRDILLANGIIVETNTDGQRSFAEGNGAIVSVSRETPDYLRPVLAAHELMHGLFFTDEDFRSAVYDIYAEADAASIEFLERYFTSQPTLNYDPADTYLMRNEFMAYMLQRPLSQIRSYFSDSIATWNSVNRVMPELARYIRDTRSEGFYNAAQALSQYIFDRWGLAAGRAWLIS